MGTPFCEWLPNPSERNILKPDQTLYRISLGVIGEEPKMVPSKFIPNIFLAETLRASKVNLWHDAWYNPFYIRPIQMNISQSCLDETFPLIV